jgi:uroporphyrinogen decarboxylase
VAATSRISYTNGAMTQMTKTERVLAALKGHAVDRVPVSAWWHDYPREWAAADLVGTTLEAYERYDFDYIKVNPRFSYYAEDFGTKYVRFPDRMPEVDEPAVRSADDLRALAAVDGTGGAYGEQLEALRLIAADLGGEAPFLQTVFSPLAALSRITGSTRFVQKLIREHPDDLEAGLETITQTLVSYARACLEAGASGVFYAAVEWGSSDNISWEDYARFGEPYDMRILEEVRGAPMNVLHVCRERNHLDHLLDYPVAAFNWDVGGEGNQPFTHVLSNTGKSVIGGVRTHTMLTGDPSDVRAEADKGLAETEGVRYLLSPGCSIDPRTPPANIEALVAAGHAAR